MMGIAGRALADQAGLCRDKSQMGLVSPSNRFAQWRDHGFGVLVLGSRCDGHRLSSTAISIRWRDGRGFRRTIWKLLELICPETQITNPDLITHLHTTSYT